jgi:hypothetical protein
MKSFVSLIAVAVLLTVSVSANAGDWIVQGKVSRLEPTFADHLNLRLDVNAGLCPAGGWLFFYGAGSTTEDKRASVKAVYAGLLASLYAGTTIEVSGLNQGCVIEQVHLLNN